MLARKGKIFNIEEYEPLRKAKELYQETKAKIEKLNAEVERAKEEAQKAEDEALRLEIMADMGEADRGKVTEAQKRAEKARKALQDLEAAFTRAKMELKIKEDIIKQKEKEAREMVAETLKDEHKKAVKKLAQILAEAVKANEEVKKIEEQWLAISRRGGNFGGLPGMLPALSWGELRPQQFLKLGPNSGGVPQDSKYSLWLKELERYGYDK
ncbi:MAG: hypothetical protein L5655_12010 [Thermosediminibacteraceae bacterium]|nr:hypothetical protein [Thermosediminibacteraceae bacterium]